METKQIKGNVDWSIVLVPLAIVIALCVVFVIIPDKSMYYLNIARSFFGDDLGSVYLLLGLGIFITTLAIAFSKIGNIRLGAQDEKPQYSAFKWGSMIFTSTMGADIVFYSCCEWSLYAAEPYVQELGVQKWASSFALFHWGPIAWSFYVILAAAFGFMLHVRKRNKQKFSEACRPLFGDKIDGGVGKAIDLFAVFSLICGAATTFSVSVPLLSDSFAEVFGLAPTKILAIVILVVVAGLYTFAVLVGMKGISKLADICVALFLGLVAYVLFFGGEFRYIIETAIESLGVMTQNFVEMSTFADPLRETSFPQNWTIYYWAYWIVWCVGTPFFMGIISKGRTIKETILGVYAWGLAGTFTSFIVLGNYGMAQQLKNGTVDVSGAIANGDSISQTIVSVLNTLPLPAIVLILLSFTMICFYSTTFDALAFVVSNYTYKELKPNEEASRGIKAYWSLFFIAFPIVLMFNEGSLSNLQGVSIVGAFPIGIIIILIAISFIKDAKKYASEIGIINKDK